MSYVYLMRSGDGERWKIGKADDVAERLRTFRTADPGISLEAEIFSRDAYALEAQLHRKFQRQRIWEAHEWFHLTPEQIKWLKALPDDPVILRFRLKGFRLRLKLPRLRPLKWVNRGIDLALIVMLVLVVYGALTPSVRQAELMRLSRLRSEYQVVIWIAGWTLILYSMRRLLRKSKRR